MPRKEKNLPLPCPMSSEPHLFTFKESGQKEHETHDLPLLLQAIGKLNASLKSGDVLWVALTGHQRTYREQPPEIIRYTGMHAPNLPNQDHSASRAIFHVSHFIGNYTLALGQEVVKLEIQPRWGYAILGYLLQYTTGIYQPPDANAAVGAQQDGAGWMLAMLWKSHFNQALRTYHLPKEYRERRTNDHFFRGRLDVARQTRENCIDHSRFACVDSPLTLDTTIGRTLRYVIGLLSKPGAYPEIMRDLSGFNERLAAFGVKDSAIKISEIDAIRYTRMSAGYRPLMRMSKAIIHRFGGGGSNTIGQLPSYFIDMAELWENYLLAVLRRHLPAEYRVFSPNEQGGDWLFVGNKRQIRPDLLIEKDGLIVAVLDAKFKSVTEIGSYEKGGVRREDLYQMGTYLYHYSHANNPILGLFVTPVADTISANVETLNRHSLHRLGVVTFDISRWEEKENAGESTAFCIRNAEEDFSRAVELELESTLRRE